MIAAHSPILLAYPNGCILQFDGTGTTKATEEDTEHVAITRDFLNGHPRRFAQLLDDAS